MYACEVCGGIYLCQIKRWSEGNNPTLIDVGWKQNPRMELAVQSCFDVWHNCATVPTLNESVCKVEGLAHNPDEPQNGRPPQAERGRNDSFTRMSTDSTTTNKRSASTSLSGKHTRKSQRLQ